MSGRWRIGENLPWVVPWSGEAEYALRPSPLFGRHLELAQAERPGDGEPMPSGMNLERQRRGARHLLCHVCGEPTPAEDRWLFPRSTGTFVQAKGRRRFATHLPPVHRACAEHAATLCPHLGAHPSPPTRFPHDAGFLAPETSLPQSLAHLAESLPAGAPIVFSYYRVFGEAFTRLVTRLRADATG